MTTTLAISGGVVEKAGANVSTAPAEAYYTRIINQAESQLIVDSGYNWVANWGTLSAAHIGGIVTAAVEDLAAMDLVNYDPNSWNLATAQHKQDILLTKYQIAAKILSDRDKRAFLIKSA